MGLPEEQTEISEKSGLPEKSGISKTKIETAKFIPTILARKYEGYYKDD